MCKLKLTATWSIKKGKDGKPIWKRRLKVEKEAKEAENEEVSTNVNPSSR